ncbi:hypothetical protein FZC35_02470 [Candidatus Cytomitobacter indipagum]|uniref:Uncharacterized protein n=1 Tax=Candidatus Cytomitobacter indipagum TaxID=2601575 RepID=A0A5C0UDX3_9PROT|nr:hypothetical protein [Candidatus Cytomitobacter indipagum]QEK38218.1 hypothetical protein FZC35_02470 [Candidatus Cytomitobacter indipagum]
MLKNSILIILASSICATDDDLNNELFNHNPYTFIGKNTTSEAMVNEISEDLDKVESCANWIKETNEVNSLDPISEEEIEWKPANNAYLPNNEISSELLSELLNLDMPNLIPMSCDASDLSSIPALESFSSCSDSSDSCSAPTLLSEEDSADLLVNNLIDCLSLSSYEQDVAARRLNFTGAEEEIYEDVELTESVASPRLPNPSVPDYLQNLNRALSEESDQPQYTSEYTDNPLNYCADFA